MKDDASRSKPHPEVAQALRVRGIAVEAAEPLGLRYLTPIEHNQALGRSDVTVPGIVIPNLHPITGEARGLRTKVLGHFVPRGDGKKNPKAARYLQPAGADNLFYFPQTCAEWPRVLRDPSVDLFGTEGELKAAAAVQQLGVPCFAMTGVDSWRQRGEDNDDSAPIADHDLIAWQARRVYLIYDSDARTNPNVRRAAHAHAKELFDRNARPYLVFVPPLPGVAKTGLDDWLKAQGKNAKQRFAELLGAATSPFVLSTMSAKEIEAMTFKTPPFVVDGVLAPGLTTLSGAPKIGKSYLALCVAYAVATGGPALGSLATKPGDVMYLALEDRPKRIQDRMRAMGMRAPATLHFAFAKEVGVGADAIAKVKRWCEDHPNAKLIVIDTLQKFRGPSADVRRNAYEHDVATLSAIKDVADQHGVAIVLVHHLRKGDAADVFERVSGSTGITGTADTNIVIERERNQQDAVLSITGRDVEEANWAVRFTAGWWTILGDAEKVLRTRVEQEIYDAIAKAGRPLSPKEIAEATSRQRTSLPKFLSRMVTEGMLEWHEGGKYAAVPVRPPSEKY